MKEADEPLSHIKSQNKTGCNEALPSYTVAALLFSSNRRSMIDCEILLRRAALSGGVGFIKYTERPTREKRPLKSEVRYDRSRIILQPDLTSLARSTFKYPCRDPLQC